MLTRTVRIASTSQVPCRQTFRYRSSAFIPGTDLHLTDSCAPHPVQNSWNAQRSQRLALARKDPTPLLGHGSTLFATTCERQPPRSAPEGVAGHAFARRMSKLLPPQFQEKVFSMLAIPHGPAVSTSRGTPSVPQTRVALHPGTPEAAQEAGVRHLLAALSNVVRHRDT